MKDPEKKKLFILNNLFGTRFEKDFGCMWFLRKIYIYTFPNDILSAVPNQPEWNQRSYVMISSTLTTFKSQGSPHDPHIRCAHGAHGFTEDNNNVCNSIRKRCWRSAKIFIQSVAVLRTPALFAYIPMSRCCFCYILATMPFTVFDSHSCRPAMLLCEQTIFSYCLFCCSLNAISPCALAAVQSGEQSNAKSIMESKHRTEYCAREIADWHNIERFAFYLFHSFQWATCAQSASWKENK